MIRAIKFLLVFVVTFLIIAAGYYASRDRFDIVACLLILINAGAVFISELWHLDKRIYDKGNFISHEATKRSIDELEEMYNTGYIDSLNEILQAWIKNESGFRYNVHVVIRDFNNLPKVKEVGGFMMDKKGEIVFKPYAI